MTHIDKSSYEKLEAISTILQEIRERFSNDRPDITLQIARAKMYLDNTLKEFMTVD